MFVDIKYFKSALAVENMLVPYKKGELAEDKKSRHKIILWAAFLVKFLLRAEDDREFSIYCR